MAQPRRIAIVGSGPAGYYTAEALIRHDAADTGGGVLIDIIDRLPVPFGLVRTGVAPDHQSIKAVARRYEGVALTDRVRFVGHVTVGTDVSVAELLDLYDAVVLATGAPADRMLEVPGAAEALADGWLMGSAAFVGWYNGHPDFAHLSPPLGTADAPADVVIIGNGNVALDAARILAKTPDELATSDIVAHARQALAAAHIASITLVGRRGPHQIAMTPKELGELGHLTRARVEVDATDLPDPATDAALEPGLRKSITVLRDFSARDRSDKATAIPIRFVFMAQPGALERDAEGRTLITLSRTRLDEAERAVATGEQVTLPATLVISAIGYRTPGIEGVAHDDAAGLFANDDGRIADRLYCVGWARRGPSGTIGTNKPDGAAVAGMIHAELGAMARDHGPRAGRDGLDALLAERGVVPVTFRDWQTLDAAEVTAAQGRAPREKFVSVDAMLEALGRAGGGDAKAAALASGARPG